MRILPESRFLTYQSDECVTAFSTLRAGGVSEGHYSSFNVNPFCGDNPAHVTGNVRLLCRALGLAPERLVMPRQTHGRNVKVIDEAFFGWTDGRRAAYLDDTDALITDCACCIGVSTADCVPLLMYDPAGRVAAVHAGWRGTVAHIAAHTVERMRALGTDPAAMTVYIGPSISQNAFEVGDEVYAAFAEAGFPMSRVAVRMDGRWHIDLWESNRLQLEAAGVAPRRIVVCGECTYSHPDRFFSARRLGIRSGRIFSGICLQSR